MADTNINHEDKTARDLSCNNQSSEALLAKIADLEESLKSYDIIFDHLPVGYVILDTRGVIINANLAVATMVDMQQDNMVGLPFTILVSEQDTQLFLDHLCRCKETKTRVCTELIIKSASSNTCCVQIISVPVFLFGGQTVRYNTTIIDISNENKLEKELQRLDRLIS